MIVNVAEFKTDLDRYLKLVGEEKIVITRDGRNIAQLSSVINNKGALIRSLVGTLPSTVTLEEARAERLARHEAGAGL